MNDFIELNRIGAVLLRRWWILLLVTLLISGMGYGFSLMQTPIYAATATLAVDKLVVANALKYSEIEAISQLMRNYADIGIRQPVLEPAILALSLEESWQDLQNRVRITPLANSQLLEISVEATTAEEAVRIANEIARQLLFLNLGTTQQNERNAQSAFAQERLDTLRLQIEQGQQQIDTLRTIQAATVLTDSGMIVGDLWVNPANTNINSSILQIQKIGEEIEKLQRMIIEWEKSYDRWKLVLQENASFKSLTILEPAQASLTPVRPILRINIIIFTSIGLVFALGLITLVEQFDDRVKPGSEIVERLGIPILGVIHPQKANSLKSWLFPVKTSLPFVLEEYRALHHKIELVCMKTPKTILVTSPNAKKRQSTMLANLGVAIAHAGYTVIIVDADWRRPTQHELFQIPNNKGLRQVLMDTDADLNLSLCTIEQAPNLKVLTSGVSPVQYEAMMADVMFPRALEQWRSPRLRHILSQLMTQADIVLVDSPPLLAFADAATMANQVDGVLLVLETGQTKWGAAKEAAFSLKQVQANLLGVVFNQTGAKLKHNPFAQSVRQSALQPTVSDPSESTFSALGKASANVQEPTNKLTSKPTSKNVSKNGLPTTGLDARLMPIPNFPKVKPPLQDRNGYSKSEKVALQRGGVTFEQLGFETVTLAGAVKAARLHLTSGYERAIYEGAQVQLETVVWLNEKSLTTDQLFPVDFLEITFNHVALQRIPLEKNGPQTFSFSIPSLPPTFDAHDLLQIHLDSGIEPALEPSMIPNTIIVIRSTSRITFTHHQLFETVKSG